MIDKIRGAWRAAKPRTRLIVGIVGVFLALCALGQLAGNDEPAAPISAEPAASLATVTTDVSVQPVAETTTEATTEAPALTVSQENAIRKAESYLDYTAFSRSGLIEQLEYEGFSTADATFAVDSLDVDWMEQAAKKAADYLDYSAFSRSGLISQLEYEGFTHEQAVYGADSVGL